MHLAPSFATAFLASLVEFVEALTVILATGSVRGWRALLAGVAAAGLALLVLVVLFGASLAHLPIGAVRLLIGTTLVLFGLRWLRKAILRDAGILPRRDEAAAFERVRRSMRSPHALSGWDGVAFGTGFQVTAVEGAEVVFVVVAVGAGAEAPLLAAGAGAALALAIVAGLGLLVHRPIARVPENRLKFAVGAMLSAFGCFWFGEAAGLRWPGGDGSILALAVGFVAVGRIAVAACRRRVAPAEIRG